jgi:hypothetical protein
MYALRQAKNSFDCRSEAGWAPATGEPNALKVKPAAVTNSMAAVVWRYRAPV